MKEATGISKVVSYRKASRDYLESCHVFPQTMASNDFHWSTWPESLTAESLFVTVERIAVASYAVSLVLRHS